jgi:hypothetical protein
MVLGPVWLRVGKDGADGHQKDQDRLVFIPGLSQRQAWKK